MRFATSSLVVLAAAVAVLACAATAWSIEGTGALAAGVFAIGVGAGLFCFFPWFMAGWTVRWILVLAALVAAARIPMLHLGSAWPGLIEGPAFTGYVALALGIVVAVRNRRAVRGQRVVDLATPFGTGTFVVMQGGDRLVNHHFGVREQRYALDLVAAPAVGFRTRPLAPRGPADFLGYGQVVVSPAAGVVVEARDGLAEPSGRSAPVEGNCVVIEPDGLPGHRVLLAHLRPGSVSVKRGDRVTTGDPLGEVGTSGNSSEPHLHIDLRDPEGNGVPLRLGGRRPPVRGGRVRSLASARRPVRKEGGDGVAR